MYLSRVEIDINNRQKMRDLTHLGAYHGWVEQSFPKEIAKGERLRHLWRIDILRGHSYLLVLSPDQPDPQKLSRYGVLGTAQTADYEKLLNDIQDGQIRPFRLTANTVRRKTQHGRKITTVITAIPELECWLLAHSQKCGFNIVTSPLSGEKELRVSDHHTELLKRGNKRISLSMTSYEGALQISDAEKFKQALTKGVGREKAYGCGLLTVMPAI